jgi:hypothetical protein
MRAQRLEVAATGDFSEKVDRAEIGRQREVETRLDRAGIPAERQPGRSPSQVGSMGSQRRDQPLDVVRFSRVDDIEIPARG